MNKKLFVSLLLSLVLLFSRLIWFHIKYQRLSYDWIGTIFLSLLVFIISYFSLKNHIN